MIERILVTGGFGYIGGRVADYLSSTEKYEVVITTRKCSTQRATGIRKANIFIRTVDLNDTEELARVCEGVTCIVHMAALNEIDSAEAPCKAILVNSLGTLNLLNAAEQAGVKQFIYFSTAHVYGAPLMGDITESMPCRPTHPYAITHKCAEDFVLAARDKRKIDGLVIRLSNGIGAPAFADVNRWTLVGNDLCRQAICEGKIVLKTAGTQRRDFIALQDVCRAVRHMIENADHYRNTDGLFNLGGDCCFRIIDIAEIVAEEYEKLAGSSIRITRPKISGATVLDPSLRYHIEKIKNIGFHPESTIREAIRETLIKCSQWFDVPHE